MDVDDFDAFAGDGYLQPGWCLGAELALAEVKTRGGSGDGLEELSAIRHGALLRCEAVKPAVGRYGDARMI
jgi:hypothetical protein